MRNHENFLGFELTDDFGPSFASLSAKQEVLTMTQRSKSNLGIYQEEEGKGKNPKGKSQFA